MNKYNKSPELAATHERNKIKQGLPLVDEETQGFLSPIVNQKGIELAGGIGVVSEFLSAKQNTVKLAEELSRFFVYRRQFFPNSKVMEMNINPAILKPSKKYYDFAIIHSNVWLNLAMGIAETTYNVSTKEINGTKPINNTEGSVNISENTAATEGIKHEEELPSVNIPVIEHKDYIGYELPELPYNEYFSNLE